MAQSSITRTSIRLKRISKLRRLPSPGWQADPPFRGRLLAILLSSATQLVEIIPAQAERDSGIGLKLFGFIAESVFTFILERCSGSSRNAVRNHPGIAFTL